MVESEVDEPEHRGIELNKRRHDSVIHVSRVLKQIIIIFSNIYFFRSAIPTASLLMAP